MPSRLAVYESLTVLTLDGYEPTEERPPGIDAPGSANWFCEQYGMAVDDFDDADAPGILWTGYDGPGWEFSVLIQTREVDAVKALAAEHGYAVVREEEVTEPTRHGDGGGTVAVCKHPEGWVIVG
jgi:predicted enzyme related to lactoylglutathione lyase